MPSYTTTEFLDSVKVRAGIPTAQNTFTSARLLALGDDAMRVSFLPQIMKAREYYYSYDDERTLNATGIYDLSSRAIGGSLLNVALLDGTSRLDVDWVTEDELTQTDSTNLGTPGCYLKRNQLILLPPAPGFTTLRMTIAIRPGKFCLTSAAAQITAINTSTKTVSFTSGTIPSTFTTAVTYDFIQDQPHFDHLAIDQVAATITTTTMIFSSLPSRLAVGDWVTLANTSPVMQVPVELQPILFQSVANTCMRAQGDMDALKAGIEELALMKKETASLYEPRIAQEGKKIVMRNSLLRRQ